MLRSALSKIADFVKELREATGAAEAAFATPDGRWTLISVSVTAAVSLSVTYLALAATPASTARAYEPTRVSAALPYELLARLTGGRQGPFIAAEDSLYRSAGLIGAPNVTGSAIDRLNAQPVPSTETKTLKVDNGDTIIGMLQDAGVSNQDAVAVVDAMKPLYSPRSIRSGQTFKATFGKPDANAAPAPAPVEDVSVDTDESHRLLSLTFSPSVEHQISVRLTTPDGYFAEDIQQKLESHYQHAGATIDSSLYLAAIQAGIPAGVVVELIHMFSYDVDFQRDVHPGDQFEVFFNHLYTPDGQPAKVGDILAASMTLSGKKHLLFRYENEDGVEYFDSNGQSAKSLLMKTPVDGARISSTFGERLHPILGYTRMHKGIDFAVPKGTPVMAAGSGTVAFAGVASGYGNFMIINHGSGYATAYGHLSRFVAHKGDRVHQGDVVAYSGMTGLATGPHLHYEIRVNNVQVNPASVKVASGRKLQGKDLVAFEAERAHIETLEASMPMQSKVAQIQGSGLRAGSVQ